VLLETRHGSARLSPLAVAAYVASRGTLKMLAAPPSPDIVYEYAATARLLCERGGSARSKRNGGPPSILRWYPGAGARVMARDSYGFTPLHLCALGINQLHTRSAASTVLSIAASGAHQMAVHQ
jgi:hypothetical protein